MDKTIGTSVHTGFPNAADDGRLQGLSLDRLLVKNPRSSFFFHVSGQQWPEQGIFAGDIALVDRALIPRTNDLTIWWQSGEFVIGRQGATPPDVQLWGKITAVIHQF